MAETSKAVKAAPPAPEQQADTVTITIDEKSASPQSLGASPFRVLTGTINITSYSATKTPYTQITGQFKTAPRVIVDGYSSGGFLARWSPADGAVRAYSAIGTEATAAANVGTVGFHAIGR